MVHLLNELIIDSDDPFHNRIIYGSLLCTNKAPRWYNITNALGRAIVLFFLYWKDLKANIQTIWSTLFYCNIHFSLLGSIWDSCKPYLERNKFTPRSYPKKQKQNTLKGLYVKVNSSRLRKKLHKYARLEALPSETIFTLILLLLQKLSLETLHLNES